MVNCIGYYNKSQIEVSIGKDHLKKKERKLSKESLKELEEFDAFMASVIPKTEVVMPRFASLRTRRIQSIEKLSRDSMWNFKMMGERDLYLFSQTNRRSSSTKLMNQQKFDDFFAISSDSDVDEKFARIFLKQDALNEENHKFVTQNTERINE